MDFTLILMLSLLGPIFFLIGYIVVKMFIKKQVPVSSYTPFDRIMGQTSVEFHEHKEVKEEEDDQGDDKNKNKKKVKK
ncbi:DUF3951 domain-containing protein [Bacillus horti]|uniref:DUF3951 domain-containing protein n=1 Tax=Caldalkalibacillus horti TaxID=77523 RepID=A0ABT9W3T5_9BACI|nr:DUF3951 domain-containing protein [Bacillus horti]MDQ0167894.1 hypothetical protein [Bacillus horti]